MRRSSCEPGLWTPGVSTKTICAAGLVSFVRGDLDHAHDAVARGLRLGGDNGHLFAGEGVEERAFADVGPAENGDESGFQSGEFSCLSIIADWRRWRRWYHLRMMVEGRTERLILRPLELADADADSGGVSALGDCAVPDEPGAVALSGGWRDSLSCRDIALPQMERGEAWHWTIRLAAEPEQIIGSISPDQGREGQSRLLAGPAVAGPGADERSLRVGERLLV